MAGKTYTPLVCRLLDKSVDMMKTKSGPKVVYGTASVLTFTAVLCCAKDWFDGRILFKKIFCLSLMASERTEEQKRELYAPSLWRRRTYNGPLSMHTWMLEISAIYQCTM
uniref:Uncharacterized protein n=1 Tax=Meloidogyne floridensis TaxID=298350 RepID=A0A915P9N5_9BILA